MFWVPKTQSSLRAGAREVINLVDHTEVGSEGGATKTFPESLTPKG
jgi:hypothetical protein